MYKKERQYNWTNENNEAIDFDIHQWDSLDPNRMPSDVNEGDFGLEIDTGILYIFVNSEWIEFGSSKPPATLISPVDNIIHNDNNFNIEFTGDYEKHIVNRQLVLIPIYTAVNSDVIYEYESHDAELSLNYIDGAEDIVAYMDDEILEDTTFNADLSDRVKLSFEGGDYGSIIYLDAQLEPNPIVEITSGSLRTDDETPSILNFTADDESHKLLIGATQPEADLILNGITYNPDSDRVKLYIGEQNDDEYIYSQWTPDTIILPTNRFLPIFIGEDVSEENHNYYDLEFQTTKKKSTKKKGKK